MHDAMKGEVDLTITNPITSNKFCNSLPDVREGYYPQGGTLYVSHIITSIMQYSQAAPSFSFHLPARSISSWQGIFFTYFHMNLFRHP